MIMVLKRDKTQVPFDPNKIISAISKAGDVSDDFKQQVANEIEQLANNNSISVENIQDEVEYRLMNSQYRNVARRYIRYRYKRELVRQSSMERNVLEIINVKNDYVNGENSNKNPQIFSTQRDYIAGEVSKDISMKMLIPEEVVQAHKDGLIHFHDSDYFIQTMHNCCLVNLEDMLQNGTVISKTLIEPPHSFHTACNIATQIIAQVASNQYGGQTISLAHLAPFVDKSRQKIREEVKSEWQDISLPNWERLVNSIVEQRVREEVKKGIQTIQYQTLTLMTTNGQTPFITVFMYLNEVAEGQLRKDLALIIEEMLRQRLQGVKNEAGVWTTPAFPKLIYVLSENNIHEGTPYYYLTELAAKCSSKRLVPDYVSEKQVWELKYPLDKLLPISKRRDLWGDESIWGANPFKFLTNEQCDILDEYVQTYRDNEAPSEKVQTILDDYNIPRNVVVPMAYCPMGLV